MKLALSTPISKRRAAEESKAPALPVMRVRSDAKRGQVRISGKPLAEAARLATRRELVDRFFFITALRVMRLDPANGTAWLSFDASEISIPEALEALAAALRAPVSATFVLPHGELLMEESAGQIEVRRSERGLTFWKVEEVDPGRFRLSHPLLMKRPIREKVLDALAGLAGVTAQTAPLLRPGSVEVRCQPHRVTAGILLDVLESALDDYARISVRTSLPIKESMVSANLVLAPISDFLFPPLGIANALLVWMLNIDHLPEAIKGLRNRRFNLELLYLCIGACTLLTFSFFGASVMYAALELWPRLVRELRVFGERQFLARYRRRPQRVWIERDGALLEMGLAELPAGEIVVMREGDIVPGDGTVLEGSGGEVLESWITGATGPVKKRPGDSLFASTELCEGEIRMRLDATGERTAAARLASWYGQALRQPSLKKKSERLADSMVLPALIFGLAAMGRGGLSMAKAVIRPDYFTGPAIAEELSQLLTIIQAAEAGFYIADQTVLDHLGDADCWIFDDSVPWKSRSNGASPFAAGLRAQGIGEVIFLSSLNSSDTARRANELGFDVHHAGYSSEAKKAFIAQRQTLGQNIAYFGDGSEQAIVAEQSNISVSVLDRRRLGALGSPAALLVPELARCGVLHTLSRARSSSVSSAFISSVIPNVAAMTGAIYLDFSVLYSVVLTNLGTLASYYRWRRTLQSAQ